jgi:hypothetical protein
MEGKRKIAITDKNRNEQDTIRLYTLMRALMLFNAAMSRVEADKQASCTHNCFSATP